jgi:hypothetical protein
MPELLGAPSPKSSASIFGSSSNRGVRQDRYSQLMGAHGSKRIDRPSQPHSDLIIPVHEVPLAGSAKIRTPRLPSNRSDESIGNHRGTRSTAAARNASFPDARLDGKNRLPIHLQMTFP